MTEDTFQFRFESRQLLNAASGAAWLPPEADVCTVIEFQGTEAQAVAVARALRPGTNEAELPDLARLDPAWENVAPEQVEETALESLAAGYNSETDRKWKPKPIGQIDMKTFAGGFQDAAGESHREHYGKSFPVEPNRLRERGVNPENALLPATEDQGSHHGRRGDQARRTPA